MLLDRCKIFIFKILSIVYLNSLPSSSSQSFNHQSLYEFYASFMLIKSSNRSSSKCLFSLLPLKEQFRFIILIFISCYFISLNFHSIQYSDTMKFILGDIWIIHTGQQTIMWNRFKKTMSWLFGYTALFFGYGIYKSFDTKKSRAFRTFIIFTIEMNNDNSITIEKLFTKNPNRYSHSTAILFIYLEKEIGLKFIKFRQLFFQIHWYSLIFHCKFFLINNFSNANNQLINIFGQLSLI